MARKKRRSRAKASTFGKYLPLIVISSVVVLFWFLLSYEGNTNAPLQPDQQTACIEDAKTCADGTVLVRDPELNCRFPECPTSGGGGDTGDTGDTGHETNISFAIDVTTI
jgi:hypothetical protein